MQAVQLSHDELLMVLGFTQLPMPLALGADPLAEYSDETLNAALASALASLMARDFVTELPADGAPATLQPELADLVSVSALADGCLMAAVQGEGEARNFHYSTRGAQAIVHSSPRERVHRLERLTDTAAIVDHLAGLIAPPAEPPAPLSFTVEAETLGEAVELAAAGKAEEAGGALRAAGVAPEAAASLAGHLGGELVRIALVAARRLQSLEPQTESAALLRGDGAAWLVEDDRARPGLVQVSAVGDRALRERIGAMVHSLATA